MFKRLLSILMICIIACTVFSGISVNALTDEVKQIEELTVSKDKLWKYFHNKENYKEIVIVAYEGSSTNISVPEKIDGKTVVGIADWYNGDEQGIKLMHKLFKDDLKVTTINLPKTVRSISDYFLTDFANYDGGWQDGIVSTDPSWTKIPPEDMEYIPSFSKDTITSITVEAENPYLSSEDGVLYNKDKSTIIRYPAGKNVEEFVIPDTVELIGTSAFANSKVKKIYISNVTKIAPYSFYKANIEKVLNSDNLNEVLEGAFLRSKIKEFPNLKKVKKIDEYTFAYCYNLTDIKIPLRVDYILDHAFYYCKNLKNVDFGKVTQIYNAAFAQCHALEEADLPITCKTLDSYAFSNCRKLKLANIGDVETIEKRAFYKCYALESLDKGIGSNRLSKAKKIDSKAFEKCSSLKSVWFGRDIELIDKKAFLDCTNLTEIGFTVYPEEIHAQAFENTAYVNNASDGIVYIDKLALCYKAPKKNQKTYLKIKEGTTTIAAWCLYKFDGIKSIYLPQSVQYVQKLNLCECEKLKRVYMSGNDIVLNEFTCENINRSKATYYVKPKAYNALKKLDDGLHKFTTDWKPSKTKSVKAVGKTKTTAKISWKKQGYVTGYKVYMKTSKNGKWKKVATVKGSDNTSYTMKGLSKNKTYYFRVRAYKTVFGDTYHGANSSSDAAKTKK